MTIRMVNVSRHRKDYQSAKIAQEGLERIIKLVSNKINENKMPKTPEEKIALADQMEREERIFQEGRKAEQKIINIRNARKARKDRKKYKKEADRAWRQYRREMFKKRVGSIWQGIKDVHR